VADRQRVALVCDECGARNYKRSKPKATGPAERLTLKKYCPQCKKHTVHRESK
jgi:large subunit ribosomal protein L33